MPFFLGIIAARVQNLALLAPCGELIQVRALLAIYHGIVQLTEVQYLEGMSQGRIIVESASIITKPAKDQFGRAGADVLESLSQALYMQAVTRTLLAMAFGMKLVYAPVPNLLESLA